MNWFSNLTPRKIVIILIAAFFIGSFYINYTNIQKNQTPQINAFKTVSTSPQVANITSSPNVILIQSPSPIATVKPTPAKTEDKPAPTQVKQTDNQNTSPISSETISQKNAVKKAKSYLGYSAFSHDGLVAQLEYEQFSHADAVYGADNSGANWNEQAAKKAKQYMEYSAFSRGSLIEQLKYEKFTQEQAEYGANAVGL